MGIPQGIRRGTAWVVMGLLEGLRSTDFSYKVA